MADGSVRWISESINRKVFEAIFPMARRERLPADWQWADSPRWTNESDRQASPEDVDV